MSLGGLVTSNGDQIYKHVIKWVVVGLIPHKFHSKCFWKKGNLVKIKKNNHKWYISSYLCLKNDLPGRWEAMFELRLKTNVDINPMESDLVVQLPFPLEFPGPFQKFALYPVTGRILFINSSKQTLLNPTNLDITSIIMYTFFH